MSVVGAILPRRVLQSTASGSPEPARVQAAVDLIVGRLHPDQLILYGSAARGHLTPASDLDFLAVGGLPNGVLSPLAHHHWECEATGDTIDVLFMTRDELESRRWCGGSVHAAALVEGRTVFVRPGVVPVRTGVAGCSAESTMVKKTLFSPEKASEFIAAARVRFNTAERVRSESPAWACEVLQASMERSLKGLIIAHGAHVEHTHNLRDLWDQAEALGERIYAGRDDKVLQDMTNYSGGWSYEVPLHEDPEDSCSRFFPLVRDVLDYAERRVPIVQAATRGCRAPRASSTSDSGAPPARGGGSRRDG